MPLVDCRTLPSKRVSKSWSASIHPAETVRESEWKKKGNDTKQSSSSFLLCPKTDQTHLLTEREIEGCVGFGRAREEWEGWKEAAAPHQTSDVAIRKANSSHPCCCPCRGAMGRVDSLYSCKMATNLRHISPKIISVKCCHLLKFWKEDGSFYFWPIDALLNRHHFECQIQICYASHSPDSFPRLC